MRVVQHVRGTGGRAEQPEDPSGQRLVHVAGQFGELVQRGAEQRAAVSHLIRPHRRP